MKFFSPTKANEQKTEFLNHLTLKIEGTCIDFGNKKGPKPQVNFVAEINIREAFLS